MDTDIVDPELSLRLGNLPESRIACIKEVATKSFFHGLSQMQALDVARAIHWLEVGKPAECTSKEIITVLSVCEIPEEELGDLAADLDTAHKLGRRRQLTELELHAASPSLQQLALLGWRLSLALELLRHYENGTS